MRVVSVSATALFSATAVFVPLAPGSPVAAASARYRAPARFDFSGTYAAQTDSGKATLTLQQDKDGGVTGTFRLSEGQLDLKGTVSADGNLVTGTVALGGQTIPTRFEVRHDGNTLSFALIPPDTGKPDPDTRVTFPLPDKAASAPTSRPTAVKPLSSSPVAEKGWKTYKHPVGLSLRYPETWSVREVPQGLLLIPPDIAGSAAAPGEIYLVRGAPSEGISSATDPRLAQVFEQQVAQMAPTLHRIGSTESIASGSAPGIRLTWEGQNPQTGKPMRVHLYGAVHGEYVLALIAIAETERATTREKTLKQIFASFGASAAERDARLVGSWQGGVIDNGKNLHDAAGRVTTSYAADSSTRVVLSADGSATRIKHSRTIVNTAAVSVDTGDQTQTTKGTWNAGDGKLAILWNGEEPLNATYHFEGERLIVQYPNGATQSFTRQ